MKPAAYLTLALMFLICALIFAFPPWEYTFSQGGQPPTVWAAPRAAIWDPPAPARTSHDYPAEWFGVRVSRERLSLEEGAVVGVGLCVSLALLALSALRSPPAYCVS